MSATPRLSDEQRSKTDELFMELEKRLQDVADGDERLLFAMRRSLRKKLEYKERGTPMERRKLKEQIWKKQRGICALCEKVLPETETELDRFDAVKGYVVGNVRLVHHKCHRKDQQAKRFA